MKKQMLLVLGLAVMAAFGSFAVAKTVGYLYGDYLIIENSEHTAVATINGSGALVAESATVSTATVTDAFVLPSRTQALIEAETSPVVGQMYICSDCTATNICISTAAYQLSWVGLESFDVACD